MTFKIMAIVTALAGTALGVRFVFAGASVLKEWNIEVTSGTLVMCRRLGALYLGLAAMFLLGQNAAASELRSAACLGVGGASLLLAGLGLMDLRTGRVSSGIVVPVIAEVVLAAGFFWAWWG